MSISRKTIVDFSLSNAGLTTVGYTVFKYDNSVFKARTTSGVDELTIGGVDTGIYTASYGTEVDESTFVIWDTGEATPKYATEQYNAKEDQIHEETQKIRVIWNTLQNNGLLYSKLLDKLETIQFPEIKEYSQEFKDLALLLQEVKDKEYPKLEDIKQALNITIPPVPAPVVNIPEVKIPDYSKEMAYLNRALVNIENGISSIPKTQKDYSGNLSDVAMQISSLLNRLDAGIKSLQDEISIKLVDVSEKLNKELVNKTQTKAEKGDISNVIKQISQIMSAYQESHKNIYNLIMALDSGLVGKVKAGYTEVVDEKRKKFSDKQAFKKRESLRIGLGIR